VCEQPVPSEPRIQAPNSCGAGVLLALAALTTGCGHTLYAIGVNAASSKFEEARELGAEQYAPYEYYMAKEHLEKARSEAAEADYGDAADLSQTAEEYAEKAITLSRQAHRGAGR
jgi:hypothetical protein